MATIAVGDLHGQSGPLRDLLSHLRTVAGEHDTVVFLGDYVDRGPDSRGCVDEIVRFRDAIAATVVGLRGNHEDWMLRTFADFRAHSWLLGMEGFETIQSYSPSAATEIRRAMSAAGLKLYVGGHELPYQLFVDAMPETHRAFFAALQLYHETRDCLCVHAGVDPAVTDIATQPPRAMVWGVPTFPAEYAGERPIVYGHRNNARPGPDGWPVPMVVRKTIGIDSISCGILTAIRMPDLVVFQSNGRETRRSRLDSNASAF
jgi:serine/threonine protein phosphatase 1